MLAFTLLATAGTCAESTSMRLSPEGYGAWIAETTRTINVIHPRSDNQCSFAWRTLPRGPVRRVACTYSTQGRIIEIALFGTMRGERPELIRLKYVDGAETLVDESGNRTYYPASPANAEKRLLNDG
jgi:hypothetical protein